MLNTEMHAAISIYTNKSGPLGKHFERTPAGQVTKTANAEIAAGHVVRREVASLQAFAALRAGLTASQALGYGVSSHAAAELTTRKSVVRRPVLVTDYGVPVIARTKEYLRWPEGPGILMLDHDPLPGSPALKPDELHRILCESLPFLREVEMLWTPSVGSHVLDAATGQEVVPLRGSRVYIWIEEASLIPTAGRLIIDHLVLNGHGAIALAGNGRMLERTLFDSAVWEPTRLDFVRPTCGPGLSWEMQPARFFGPTGGVLRKQEISHNALGAPQRQRLAETWATLRADSAEAASAKREEWARLRATEALGPGATPQQIELRTHEVADAISGGRLAPSHKLHLQDGRTITVADVLADPDAFDGQRLCDPAEPNYGHDTRIARIRVAHDGSISIGSYAHGWSEYEIKGPTTAEEDLAGIEPDDAPEQPEVRGVSTAKAVNNSRLRVWLPGELAQRQPPRWLVSGWLPERGVAGLVGESNVGKSFLMLQLCVAIAEGWDWLGMPVEQGASLYVAAEGEFGMPARLAAIEQHYGVSLAHSPCGVVTNSLDLRSSTQDADRVIEAARDLHARVGQPVKVIVLDTLARMIAGGDENSSVDMGGLINSATRIAEEVGALVVLVHHTGKDASKGARGHSSLRAALDTQIIVEKRNGVIDMRLDKQRDGSTDLRASYRLQSVTLGVSGDTLQPTSSAVVVRADAVVAPARLHLNLWQGFAYQAWVTADALHERPTFEQVMNQASPMLEALGKLGENSRKLLKRALRELVDSNVLKGGEEGYESGAELGRVVADPILH